MLRTLFYPGARSKIDTVKIEFKPKVTISMLGMTEQT
jgi:hypothetical protein